MNNKESIEQLLRSRNIEPTEEEIKKFSDNLDIVSREKEAEINFSRMNEKVTALPIGEKSFIEDTLLVGVYFNNELHKDIKVEKPDGLTITQFFDEKCRNNPFLAVEAVLTRSVHRIGKYTKENTKEQMWRSLINKLAIVDSDYIVLLMAIAGKVDDVVNPVECVKQSCKAKFEIEVSPKDLIPYETEDGAIVFENTDPYMYFVDEENEQYTAKVKVPQLRDAIDIFRSEESAVKNPLLYNYFLWSKCVKQINGKDLNLTNNDISLFASLNSDFVEWLTEEWESNLPKIDTKLEARCISCDSEINSGFTPIFFLLRERKKLENSKKEKKKKKRKLRKRKLPGS